MRHLLQEMLKDTRSQIHFLSVLRRATTASHCFGDAAGTAAVHGPYGVEFGPSMHPVLFPVPHVVVKAKGLESMQ